MSIAQKSIGKAPYILIKTIHIIAPILAVGTTATVVFLLISIKECIVPVFF